MNNSNADFTLIYVSSAIMARAVTLAIKNIFLIRFGNPVFGESQERRIFMINPYKINQNRLFNIAMTLPKTT